MLQPQLQDWKEQFESLKNEAQGLTGGLTPAQFNWHPKTGSWSIAECIDHLNVIGHQMLPLMDKALKEARQKGITGPAPYNLGIVGRWFSQSQEPPVRRKFKTSKVYMPPPNRSMEEVVPAFLRLQDDMIDRLQKADGLDLLKIKITSPAMKIMRMNLAGWFAGLATHERRHLWQAHQVREAPGFPRG